MMWWSKKTGSSNYPPPTIPYRPRSPSLLVWSLNQGRPTGRQHAFCASPWNTLGQEKLGFLAIACQWVKHCGCDLEISNFWGMQLSSCKICALSRYSSMDLLHASKEWKLCLWAAYVSDGDFLKQSLGSSETGVKSKPGATSSNPSRRSTIDSHDVGWICGVDSKHSILTQRQRSCERCLTPSGLLV